MSGIKYHALRYCSLFSVIEQGWWDSVTCFSSLLRSSSSEWFSPSPCPSVSPSVYPSHIFDCSRHPIIMKFLGVNTNDKSDAHAEGQCQTSTVKFTEVKAQFSPFQTVLQLKFTYDDEMMHKVWCCSGEVPYYFSRSSVKFQGHAARQIVDFYPILTPIWIHLSLLNDPQSLK